MYTGWLTRNVTSRKKKNDIFEMRLISLREWKCNEKVAEEYCWAITQAMGRSCCGRSGSSVLDFTFQLGSLLCTQTVDHMYTQIRLTLNSTCDGPSRKHLLRKSWKVFTLYMLECLQRMDDIRIPESGIPSISVGRAQGHMSPVAKDIWKWSPRIFKNKAQGYLTLDPTNI